jgi:hypothetical protein
MAARAYDDLINAAQRIVFATKPQASQEYPIHVDTEALESVLQQRIAFIDFLTLKNHFFLRKHLLAFEMKLSLFCSFIHLLTHSLIHSFSGLVIEAAERKDVNELAKKASELAEIAKHLQQELQK